ncbi:hypothetical protein [Blastococcus sp. SYSU D00820]
MSGPWAPAGQPGAGPQVAWTPGGQSPAGPAPARPPVDVGGLLRLVAGALLLVAGVLLAIAPFLTLYSVDGRGDIGDYEFVLRGFDASDGEGSAEGAPRYGFALAGAALLLLVGGALVLAARWNARLRTVAAGIAVCAVGAVVGAGWVLTSFVGDLADRNESRRGESYWFEIDTGGGGVMLVIAMVVALVALAVLLLAPVFDHLRARSAAASAGGAR